MPIHSTARPYGPPLTLLCLHCERIFVRPAWIIRQQPGKGETYCSRACMAAARRAVLESTCQHCGSRFHRAPSIRRVGDGRYCSAACQYAAVKTEAPSRFWSLVQRTAHCWWWQGRVSWQGYGQFDWWLRPDRARPRNAHQIAWELTHGPIPRGLFVCHHCDHPLCVKPAHLYLGTAQDNSDDMCARKRQHAVLTPAMVREIRTRFSSGERPITLARAYGVTAGQISNIVRGISWKHLL